MNRNDTSIAPIEGTRNVERLAVDHRHEECLRMGFIIGIGLNYISHLEDSNDLCMGHSPQAHPALGVKTDRVAVLTDGLARLECRVGP
jgi:hypothetical protein